MLAVDLEKSYIRMTGSQIECGEREFQVAHHIIFPCM